MADRDAGARPGPAARPLVAGGWRVSVDSGRCIGSGLCAATAPAYFQIVDGTSRPPADPIGPDDAALDIADSCPVEAITVCDAATGEVLAPRP